MSIYTTVGAVSTRFRHPLDSTTDPDLSEKSLKMAKDPVWKSKKTYCPGWPHTVWASPHPPHPQNLINAQILFFYLKKNFF